MNIFACRYQAKEATVRWAHSYWLVKRNLDGASVLVDTLESDPLKSDRHSVMKWRNLRINQNAC